MATTIKARIQLKHDTEENWNKALNFIPLKGQPIIYDADPDNGQPFPRLKVGDGTTIVVDLPFISSSNTDKDIQYNTTQYWNTQIDYIPTAGQIIIYSDKYLTEYNTNTPAIKIGDGTTFVTDLPFLTDIFSNQLNSHINNNNIHVSIAQKAFWDNKINCEDIVIDQNLQLTRR